MADAEMKSRLLAIFSYIESGLIERAVPVRLSLLAALSGEHLLLLGPPGTAKSEMARKLYTVFSNINYFERLLTRFSVPEELFGPLSIKALEQDRYHRLTRSYLPDASIAFIDEIFKANSAILNSLLTLLNEREFDNGSVRVATPLISVIAASNELPEDDGLEALFDRFLIRYQLQPVSNDGFAALLDLQNEVVGNADEIDKLSEKDIETIQQSSSAVELSDQAREIFFKLKKYLAENSIYISDRRWRKALKILQVSACTNGKKQIDKWDCVLLSHLLWQTPDQIEGLNNWFVDVLDLNIDAAVKRTEKLLGAWETQLHEDSKKFTQKTNTHGEYLYTTPEGDVTTQSERVSLAERDNEVLYLAPPDVEDRTNRGKGYTLKELEQSFFDDNYKQTHIDGRWVDVQNYINNTQNRLVNRVRFEALVEPWYFSETYVVNQADELQLITDELNSLNNRFASQQKELQLIRDNHLWLSVGLLSDVNSKLIESLPKLIDYHQRIQLLLDINRKLKIKNQHSLSS